MGKRKIKLQIRNILRTAMQKVAYALAFGVGVWFILGLEVSLVAGLAVFSTIGFVIYRYKGTAIVAVLKDFQDARATMQAAQHAKIAYDDAYHLTYESYKKSNLHFTDSMIQDQIRGDLSVGVCNPKNANFIARSAFEDLQKANSRKELMFDKARVANLGLNATQHAVENFKKKVNAVVKSEDTLKTSFTLVPKSAGASTALKAAICAKVAYDSAYKTTYQAYKRYNVSKFAIIQSKFTELQKAAEKVAKLRKEEANNQIVYKRAYLTLSQAYRASDVTLTDTMIRHRIDADVREGDCELQTPELIHAFVILRETGINSKHIQGAQIECDQLYMDVFKLYNPYCLALTDNMIKEQIRKDVFITKVCSLQITDTMIRSQISEDLNSGSCKYYDIRPVFANLRQAEYIKQLMFYKACFLQLGPTVTRKGVEQFQQQLGLDAVVGSELVLESDNTVNPVNEALLKCAQAYIAIKDREDEIDGIDEIECYRDDLSYLEREKEFAQAYNVMKNIQQVERKKVAEQVQAAEKVISCFHKTECCYLDKMTRILNEWYYRVEWIYNKDDLLIQLERTIISEKPGFQLYSKFDRDDYLDYLDDFKKIPEIANEISAPLRRQRCH